jgi:hypothetical protein
MLFLNFFPLKNKLLIDIYIYIILILLMDQFPENTPEKDQEERKQKLQD